MILYEWHPENKVLSDLHRLKSLEVVSIFIFRKHACILSYVSKVNRISCDFNVTYIDISK